MTIKDWKKIKNTRTRIIYNKKGSRKSIFIDKTLASNWVVLIGKSNNVINLRQLEMSFLSDKVLGHWRFLSTANKNAESYMRSH